MDGAPSSVAGREKATAWMGHPAAALMGLISNLDYLANFD
jgi:hypothetical protein